MSFIDYPDREMLAIDLANHLAGELETCLLNHPHASFAVPGGSTPGPIFDALCAADLDWARVHVMATDERWVDMEDPRSNARLIRERLLVNRAAAAQFVPFYAPSSTPEPVLGDIVAGLERDMPISVLVLGMGGDMHTASLFPGAPGLSAALAPDAPILSILRPENIPETRISLSARVLDQAMSKHVVIYGADKRAAYERAMTLPPEEAPIQAVMSDLSVHWAE
ncbi:MAG: 6-phosphogluconolactonase [Sedimentitalea sp.]